MRLDALTAPVPPLSSAKCVRCRRLTTVPIRIGPDRYACPQCAPEVTPWPIPGEFESERG
ncbi:hypothetical protein [Streptomyces albipurpureus]|uniref:hypothetical protein n=1 Tax=Streptomyces albipurpureus TaxID=2897419 RepID=UPI003CE4D989